MQDAAFPNTNNMNREERWEARRRVKMGIQGGDANLLKPAEPSASSAVVNQPGMPSFPAGEPQAPPNFSNVPTDSNNPSMPVPQSNFVSPSANPIPQNAKMGQPDPYLNAKPLADFPRQENPPEFYLPEPVLQPPDNQQQAFFTNPVSEAEQKRAQMIEEYKKHAQEDMRRLKKPDGYLPENRERPASRGNIRMISAEQQQIDSKKKQYQIELNKQIQERQQVKQGKPKTPPQEFFPFGKPGAGAPRRDAFGNIIAMRAPKLNENDPNFMRPGDYYQEIADPSQSAMGHASFSHPQGNDSFNYQQPPNYSQAYPPGNIPPPQQVYQPPPQQAYQPPPQQAYQPPPQQAYQPSPQQTYKPPPQQAYQPPPQQTYQFQPPPQYQQPPNVYQHPHNNYPSNQDLIPPAHQLLENHIPPPPEVHRQSPQGFAEPSINLRESQDPQEDASRMQKKELARALQEQIDERRRKREEEKRQKILEERLEEERIERERRQMEEEVRREAEKRKKKMQDMQNFNVQVVHEPKKPGKRVRTPLEVSEPRRPPMQPPSFQPPPIEPPVEVPPMVSSVPRSPENGRNRPSDSTVVRNLQSQVDSEMAKLKQEFNQQQVEMRQAIFKLQEETRDANFHRKGAEMELEKLKEELKQREIQDELRQKELFQAMNHPQPPLSVVKPRQPPPKTLDQYDSLDIANKSLSGESKFIPLAKPDPIFPPEPQPKKELDNLFPSLPDSIRTANSSIGIDRINKRNDERLKALEGVDASDEISKLDNLLKYLDGNPPQSRGLTSINEIDEDFNYSLPDDRSFT